MLPHPDPSFENSTNVTWGFRLSVVIKFVFLYWTPSAAFYLTTRGVTAGWLCFCLVGSHCSRLILYYDGFPTCWVSSALNWYNFFPEKKQSVYIMWTLTNKVFFCCFWKWEAPWLCIKLGHSLSPSKLHYFSNFSSSFILPRNLLDFHFILDVKYFSKRYLALIALILLDVCASFIQIIYSH